MRLDGINIVQAHLQKVVAEKKAKMKVALMRAGYFLQRESQRLVPIQTGNLRGSAFVRGRWRVGIGFEVRVGYTAAYAIYVHEDMDAAHGEAFNQKYADKIAQVSGPRGNSPWFRRGPKQQAKFLETAYRQNITAIRTMISEGLK